MHILIGMMVNVEGADEVETENMRDRIEDYMRTAMTEDMSGAFEVGVVGFTSDVFNMNMGADEDE